MVILPLPLSSFDDSDDLIDFDFVDPDDPDDSDDSDDSDDFDDSGDSDDFDDFDDFDLDPDAETINKLHQRSTIKIQYCAYARLPQNTNVTIFPLQNNSHRDVK